MDRSNADWFGLATQFEAMKQSITIAPHKADLVKDQGRVSFYETFWSKKSFEAMSVPEIRNVATKFFDLGYLNRMETSLMGMDYSVLDFASDQSFATSPLSLLANAYQTSHQYRRTHNWIREYESQLAHLTENGADAKAIQGTRNVLAQLRRLQTERSMYEAMGLNDRDEDERRRTGYLEQGLLSPSLIAQTSLFE